MFSAETRGTGSEALFPPSQVQMYNIEKRNIKGGSEMAFYEDRLEPMLRKTAKVIEETPAMQSIVNGTMTMDQLRYYYLQDYAYLLDYT